MFPSSVRELHEWRLASHSGPQQCIFYAAVSDRGLWNSALLWNLVYCSAFLFSLCLCSISRLVYFLWRDGFTVWWVISGSRHVSKWDDEWTDRCLHKADDLMFWWVGCAHWGMSSMGMFLLKLGGATPCMCHHWWRLRCVCVGGWAQLRASQSCRGRVSEQRWLMGLCHMNEPQTKPSSLNWSIAYFTSSSFFPHPSALFLHLLAGLKVFSFSEICASTAA